MALGERIDVVRRREGTIAVVTEVQLHLRIADDVAKRRLLGDLEIEDIRHAPGFDLLVIVHTVRHLALAACVLCIGEVLVQRARDVQTRHGAVVTDAIPGRPVSRQVEATIDQSRAVVA